MKWIQVKYYMSDSATRLQYSHTHNTVRHYTGSSFVYKMGTKLTVFKKV